MKSISIMGCGWLGLPLAEKLVQLGYTVKGSTTSQDKIPVLESKNIQPYLIPKGALHITPSDFFESDIIFINVPPRNTPDDPEFHEKNMKAVRFQIPEGKKIIFISSTAVYPSTNLEVSEEDASEECLSRGGVSLVKIENIFASDHTTILRLGGLYGGDRHPGRFLSGKTIGGKDNAINMTHLDDAIQVILHILEKERWGDVFNACSPIHPSKEQFYMDAAKDLGVPAPNFTDEDVDFKIVNSDKLIEAIEYRFQH